jgi:hypothetical protein
MVNWAGIQRFCGAVAIQPVRTFIAILAVGFFMIGSTPALHAATVTGHAYLQGQANNSGINVVFTAQSLSATSDSTTTDSSGTYSLTLANGVYEVFFTKPHYYPDTIAAQVFSGNDTLASQTLEFISVPFRNLAGNIDGVLQSDSVYYVVGNATVPENDSLIIQPGT